jgi:hypothetical protein
MRRVRSRVNAAMRKSCAKGSCFEKIAVLPPRRQVSMPAIGPERKALIMRAVSMAMALLAAKTPEVYRKQGRSRAWTENHWGPARPHLVPVRV